MKSGGPGDIGLQAKTEMGYVKYLIFGEKVSTSFSEAGLIRCGNRRRGGNAGKGKGGKKSLVNKRLH